MRQYSTRWNGFIQTDLGLKLLIDTIEFSEEELEKVVDLQVGEMAIFDHGAIMVAREA
jgi:hypothetical protein